MKTKSLVVIATLVAFMGIAHAEVEKKKGKCQKGKKPTSEQVEKFDKNKDGKLSKKERAEMRKDRPAKGKKPKGKRKKKGKKRNKKGNGN
ncbi:MAG: hypothetical protein N2A42_07345 [Luteolibacter sp.]